MKNKILFFCIFLLCILYHPATMAQAAESFNTSLVNFTPQFFICIIAGLLLAMGFQVVLTILSVAFGVTLIGNLEKTSNDKPGPMPSTGETEKKNNSPIL